MNDWSGRHSDAFPAEALAIYAANATRHHGGVEAQQIRASTIGWRPDLGCFGIVCRGGWTRPAPCSSMAVLEVLEADGLEGRTLSRGRDERR